MLVPAALGDLGGDGQDHYRRDAQIELQLEQYIFRGESTGNQSMGPTPDSHARGQQQRGGGLALSEPECGPQQSRTAEKRQAHMGKVAGASRFVNANIAEQKRTSSTSAASSVCARLQRRSQAM